MSRWVRRAIRDAAILLGRITALQSHSDDAYRLFSGTGIAALVAWLGLLLGIVVSVWGADVREATRSFGAAVQQGGARPPHWPSFFFWVGLIVWARLLYLRLTVDEEPP